MNHSDVHHPPPGAPLFPVEPRALCTGAFVLHESLGSWLHRFCQHNGFMDFRSVLTNTYGSRPGAATLTDAPIHFHATVAMIAQATWQPPESIQWLMLCDILMVMEGRVSGCNGRWRLRASRETPGMRHAICPLCVSEFSDPFWLQTWRLATTTQCHVHKVMLLDCCPDCKSPFVIQNYGIQRLDQCEHCFLQVSGMPVEACSIDRRAPDFALNAGDNLPGYLPVAQQAEHDWWLGIRKILTLIEDPGHARYLVHTGLPSEFFELLIEISLSPRQSFDAWPIQRRHNALRFMDWLTALWPERFIRLLTPWGRNYKSTLCLNTPGAPWIQSALKMIPVVVRRAKAGSPPKRLQRALHSSPTASLSIRVQQRSTRGVAGRGNQRPTQRWTPHHTARIVQMIDARVLSMRGAVDAKARFLQGAMALVLERGSPALLTGGHADSLPDSPLVQAHRTMNAWDHCLRHWYTQVCANALKTLDAPVIRPSAGRISKWLACGSSGAQTSLFNWTEQTSAYQQALVQPSPHLSDRVGI